MSQTLKNSAFKVKAGSVATTLGIIPEKGAILFDESQNTPVIGDGFNWLTFTPSIDAIALVANGDIYSDAMTVGVPIEPADFFSVIRYNLGTAFTVSIPGQSVTINTTGSYRINYFFNAQSDAPNTTFLFDISVDGTPLGVPIVNFLPKKDTPVSFSGQFVVPGITATDILTLWIQSDKSATVQRFGQEIGISLVV